ncbi:hypothetical protein [Ornithinimicrobium cerasi]|uniref:hypothetical protein n=1 Tax=Ornithinimicrobium cerasi TaxID=2248773 RepID=UPI00137A2344|nr:hypothetical protein [Ornithinimicrobium cerasi]
MQIGDRDLHRELPLAALQSCLKVCLAHEHRVWAILSNRGIRDDQRGFRVDAVQAPAGPARTEPFQQAGCNGLDSARERVRDQPSISHLVREAVGESAASPDFLTLTTDLFTGQRDQGGIINGDEFLSRTARFGPSIVIPATYPKSAP